MKPEDLPDLSGKLVRFTIRGSEGTGGLVSDPRFEMQGNRLFIVGTVPRGGSSADWIEGIPAAIAWDDVIDYHVFDSLKHYDECKAKYDKAKRKQEE